MAFETVTKAAGSYIDSVKPLPKSEGKQHATQTSSTSVDSVNVATEMAVSKMTGTNQENPYSNKEEQQKKDGQTSEKQLKAAVSEAQNKLKGKRTGCEFTYHEDSKRVSIKVFDKDTKEVIREIPPEESVEMVEKLWELAGLIVDEKR